jgi:hypothetical protein
MSLPCKTERSLLSHEEFETVRVTHHPAIYELTPAQLRTVLVRLREMRDKERTLARQRQREFRSKAEPRGGSFAGTVEKPLQRKQIFASAKKRVNKELKRVRGLEARSNHIEAAHRALALRRSTNFAPIPSTHATSHSGMRPSPNMRRRTKAPPSKVGSISQATKVAQAARDSRN